MIFLGILVLLAFPILALGVAVYLSSHASEKQRQEHELERIREQQKRKEINMIAESSRQKELELKQKQVELERQIEDLERKNRFVYDNSVVPRKVLFAKDNLEDYVESIPPTYLYIATSLTRIHHTYLTRILEIAKDEFENLCVSPRFSVNCASLLLYYAHAIAWKYDGEYHDVSHSVNQAIEKLFLMCGFNEYMDATHLNNEFNLFHDTSFFFVIYDDDTRLFRDWDSNTSSESPLFSEELKFVFNLFADISFLPFFFSAKNYQNIYASSDARSQIPPITSGQQFLLDHIIETLSDFRSELIETFEKEFSETNRSEYSAADNDELAFIYGYESKDYKIYDYYFPFPRKQ